MQICGDIFLLKNKCLILEQLSGSLEQYAPYLSSQRAKTKMLQKLKIQCKMLNSITWQIHPCFTYNLTTELLSSYQITIPSITATNKQQATGII